ncbi:hypothetical protein BLAT2472_10732 [Burkholderia latens]|uniref:hypothetical protein n=1 Tax=Burkholderia latens TaxID=488446 RepID=UPI0039A6C1FD
MPNDNVLTDIARRDIEHAQEAEAVDWRELTRRLYVELFYCDQQMTGGRRPKWTQGAEVRDVLRDAKAALETVPQPAQADARVGLTMTREQRGVLTRLATVLETGHANNGIADDNAEIYAMAIRALLATPQPEPRAEVTADEFRALLQLETAIRHDREMFEGTSDEDNPMGSLVTAALSAIDAARAGASS